jgi:IMP dehydrogenase/GMP reductase
MQFDFNDYVLVQAAFGLNSRSEVKLEYLPIITAPMDTVVDETNAHYFRDQGITICLPRSAKASPNTTDFISVGLNEFKALLDGETDLNYKKICVDVANGNMPLLHELIVECKLSWPKSIIMSGNIASESAYLALASAGCDYIRVGVGSGSGCLTSVHTGVGQGMATLIQRCHKMRLQRDLQSLIVADGGFKNYRDIIMALSMGADYVMLGGILNKCLESCAPKTIIIDESIYKWVLSDKPIEFFDNINSDRIAITFDKYLEFLEKYAEKFPELEIETDLSAIIKKHDIYVNYRGMSTKSVQRDWGREKLKSSEGIEKVNKVEYTINGWMENFLDYLKSAMSYCGASTLSQFRNVAEFETITPTVYNRFNK